MKAASSEAERETLNGWIEHFERMKSGRPFLGKDHESTYGLRAENLHVSQCYTCGELAIWLHDVLLYPATLTAPGANPDLSGDVLADYEEARKILDLSPRGAAALLRLVIDKICIELDAKGDTIDQRIASLVSSGLPVEVQQALDAVRVIGNHAVHPGKLDLKDDRDTALKLFDLVNFIAYDRISRPKAIRDVYSMLPESARQAIDARNAKALGKK